MRTVRAIGFGPTKQNAELVREQLVKETLVKETSPFEKHIQLILYAETRLATEILDTLRVLPSLNSSRFIPKKSMDSDETLFSTVLRREDLTAHEKYEILFLAFYRGYEMHYLMLLTKPNVTHMLAAAELFSLLLLCYQHAIRNGQVGMITLHINKIWKVLLAHKDNYPWIIVSEIIKTQNSALESHFIYLVMFWLNELNDANKVRHIVQRLCEEIQASCFKHLSEDVLKLGKIRILEVCMQESKPVEVNERVKVFLNQHRSTGFFFTLHSPKSEKILELMERDPALAKKLWEEDKQQFMEKLNLKLEAPRRANRKWSL